MSASASVGKLPALDSLLTANEPASESAKLLNALFKLKASGVAMTVEKIERLH